jgi:phage terminase large subunit GpA-like protein
MEAFADESVNEIAAMCSAQSAKTLTILCLMAWAIAEDPGPILWVTSSLQEARKFAKMRLIPLLEKCGPVAARFPRERNRKTTLEIYFPGAPLIITGSESEASLQSTPFRYIFLDETRSYPPGAVEMVSKRTRSYTHNYKRVFISTPDMEGDAVHRAFLSGDQRHYEVKCQNSECGHFQELQWHEKDEKGGLKWDTTAEDVVTVAGATIAGRIVDDTGPELVIRVDNVEQKIPMTEIEAITRATKLDGKYDFDRLKATVRYECEACGHRVLNNDNDRKPLTRDGNGRWVVKNPSAPSNTRSFFWNALLPWWTNWADQVVEFLTAMEALKNWNDFAPLKDHINETRGQPWTDKLRYASDEKFIHLRARDYDPRAVWEEEKRRFGTIDVQARGGRHFWLCIRAWALAAKSRKLFYGRIWSIEEVRALLKEWNVEPQNVGIDAGTFTSEVYKYCVESGYRWKPMKGDDKPFFRVTDRMMHVQRHRMFTISQADPAIGTRHQGTVRPLNQYIWSKPSALDRLALFQYGLAGDWQIYSGMVDGARVGPPVSEEYAMQVTAYDRRQRTDPRGVIRTEWHQKREDHATSCELMQIICADATDLLSAPDLPLFQEKISAN